MGVLCRMAMNESRVQALMERCRLTEQDRVESERAMYAAQDRVEALEAENERLRMVAKRILEADMLGVRDLDALNELEAAAGFGQQGQARR